MSKTASTLTTELQEILTSVDTPTICNALEIIVGTPAATAFTHGAFICAHPRMRPILGFARTATLRCTEQGSESPSSVKARQLCWYEHIAGVRVPTISVVQDIDNKPGFGAFLGEINSHVLKSLGVCGVITNGAIRDFGMLAENFQILAGSISPSYGFSRIVDIAVPVQINGLTINNGDLLHADAHGAVVINQNVLKELPHAIAVAMARDSLLLEASRRLDFNVDHIRTALLEAKDIY